jgi:hypothetical protein
MCGNREQVNSVHVVAPELSEHPLVYPLNGCKIIGVGCTYEVVDGYRYCSGLRWW